MKYLIKTHAKVGDLAFNIALMNVIARIDPGCHMDVIVPSPVNQLLEDTPYIANLWVHPTSFIADSALKIRLLRKDYDVAIICQGGGYLRLFYRLLKAKFKRHRVDLDGIEDKHEIELQASMLEGILDGWEEAVDPTIHFDYQRIFNTLNMLGLNRNEKLLSIAPGAYTENKMWDKDKFVALAKNIGKNFDQILVLGSENEHELCEYVANNSGGCMNLSGKLELLDACALLSVVSLHIGNDSGLGHLAASSGTSSLAIGDENGLRCSPWQQHMLLGDAKKISLEEVLAFLHDKKMIQID